MLLQKNDVVLFQGDSITDCGRNRDNLYDLGVGYPLVISSLLYSKLADLNLKFINKGISGNRVYDLRNRWQQDCLDLKPTVVSILIGINDTWRRYDSNVESPIKDFTECYRSLLTDVKEKLGARIIIMEPFLIPNAPEKKVWREDLDPRIQAVRELAIEFDATFVPLDGPFTAAYIKNKGNYLSGDGVHPSYAGHGLIAREWCKAVGVTL
ncbi:MAG TPA: SGNH/GDSL hydrolase family protein [Clostridiales bacterium]|nr:SGNH/GDSL hydrolase family protein [Clostridiales bacterium]